MRLLLASASPRRADLLKAAGFVFDMMAVDVDETPRIGEAPDGCALRLAREKAARALAVAPDAVVIAADTLVVVDGRVFGKPGSDDDATRMLGVLSGREHEVLTGVVVQDIRQSLSEVARTRVRFAALTPGEIAWYVASGEPRGKAGAYGIQGLASRFVESIQGSYTNVVGLPIAVVYRLLVQLMGAEAGARGATATD